MIGELWKKYREDIIIPLLAIAASFVIAAIILAVAGYNPVEAFSSMLTGAFGDSRKIANTLLETTPLIFTGLAIAFAFRCGLFNIGVEGQLLVGSIAAAYVGYRISLPMVIHLPLAILAAMAAGALWASVPGILKARLGVHEVINTIMMNYIAYALVAFLGTKVLIEPPGTIPQTPLIAESAELFQIKKFLPINSRLNAGLFIAVIAVLVFNWLLYKTVLGYEVRAVGLSSTSAEYGGINVSANIVLAMVISGMFAGLCGAERVLGLHHRYIQGFSPGYGFIGIAVALLGRNSPVGIFMAALLFGILDNGGAYMARVAKTPQEIVNVVQGIIIFFVASEYGFRKLFEKVRKSRKAVEKNA